ncbi:MULTISPECIES: cold-shock protein [Paenibacillus]|uniref:cold-shock protein n=1 Tax=Paenibacillus TaxID=44249 RepID=UPI0004363961|nr:MULTISPECIES: cold-shock protein [Paenibacillus]ASS67911.1 hypothetical protein CIC07_18575 [Paenibacillus sp. RUD330]KKC48591.1 hypothetical protein VE23_18335 [Paenibacillus sp. D9]CDN41588.1 Uncharacterized protein YdjO [Paenibacillus sp. P22]SIR44235.1 Cold-inducible protein YdjO [Paenibacillus sp. RU4X]SIR54028.1 Cold-inducible protein YdjO [Paenibacillus sp. RU4T]
MYYSRKKTQEELPTEMTPVWTCSKDGCNGWMRKDYAFEQEPVCSICSSPMTSGMRDLPVLMESTSALQAAKKKAAASQQET